MSPRPPDAALKRKGVDRGWVFRIAVIYAALIGIWVLLQSGAPLALFYEDVDVDRLTWLQTLTGWFFVLASAWLLYLMIEKNVRAEREAAAALRLRDRAIETTVNAIVVADAKAPDYPITYVNPAFERITGYSSSEVLGRNPRFLHGDDKDQPGLQELREALAAEQPVQVVVRNYKRDGTMFWNELSISPVRDDEGRVTHYIGIQNDVTETRHYQDALRFQANYDWLTRLPNRALLEDRLQQAIIHGDRYQKLVAVAMFNLDNFSMINESFGREAGDHMLEEVAYRIAMCVRSVDTLARLAGDEFALVSYEHEGVDSVSAELQRVLETLSRPFEVGGREIFMTCSTGVALFPQDGETVEDLMRKANIAVRRAKEQGKNTLQFYTTEMSVHAGERFDLYNKLRQAMERRELLLHYQPQVDLRGGQIVGVEALIRWQSPELGMMPPARFIPLAEETGLIIPIGAWALKTACAQNRRWQDSGLRPIRVAVNLSALQFRQKDLAELVAATLQETRLEARYLELELTESMVMHNPEEAIRTLQKLRDMGVLLSIDDFGTGYSSLNYLKRFRVHRLKIDHSFVRDITVDEDNAAIARAVITLGHTLNLKVTAEGVETREQLVFLRDSGCDEKQGYLFSRPVPAEEIVKLLQEERTLAA